MMNIRSGGLKLLAAAGMLWQVAGARNYLQTTAVLTVLEAEFAFDRGGALLYDDERRFFGVVNAGAHTVGLYNEEGMPLVTIGSGPALQNPVGAAVTPQGIAVTEAGSGILRFFDESGRTAGQWNLDTLTTDPGRMCAGKDGDLYLVDRAGRRIIMFDRAGRVVNVIGGPGEGPGWFGQPEDVAVDSRGRILVTDSQGIPVQVFDADGEYLFGLGENATAEEQFRMPSGIAVDDRDHIWVTDSFRHQVKVFDEQGTLVTQWGRFGAAEGSLDMPIDIMVDHENRLYILEKGSRRVQVFNYVWN